MAANFPKSRTNEQVGRKRRAVVGLAGGPSNGRAVREPRRWDDGHKKDGTYGRAWAALQGDGHILDNQLVDWYRTGTVGRAATSTI